MLICVRTCLLDPACDLQACVVLEDLVQLPKLSGAFPTHVYVSRDTTSSLTQELGKQVQSRDPCGLGLSEIRMTKKNRTCLHVDRRMSP